MSVFATTTSPLVTGIGVGTGASKYTDIVTQSANILASGSNASVTDQLNAFQTLQSLIFSDVGGPNGGILEQTNKNDWQRAVNAFNNSDIIQQIQQVGAQFGGALSSALSFGGGSSNVAQDTLNSLSRFSQGDQQIIFVGGSLNVPGALVQGGQDIYYANLDNWKADLKKQAAAFVSAVSPAATATAPTSANGGHSAVNTMEKAVVTLPPKPGASAPDASIALETMLKFQDEMSTSKLAAAAPAKKTHSIPNDTGSKITVMVQTLSMLQTISSDANPVVPAGHLDQIA